MGVVNDTKQELANADVVAEAAKQTVQALCGVDLQVRPDQELDLDGGMILAVISLMGDVDWAVFMGLPAQTATSIAEKFAGFPIPFDSADMGDAIGELCNILVGQVKGLLDQRGLSVEISLPSVMRMANLQVFVQRDRMARKTIYDSPLGGLWTGIIAGKM